MAAPRGLFGDESSNRCRIHASNCSAILNSCSQDLGASQAIEIEPFDALARPGRCCTGCELTVGALEAQPPDRSPLAIGVVAGKREDLLDTLEPRSRGSLFEAPLHLALVRLPRAQGPRRGVRQLRSHAHGTACQPGNRGPVELSATSPATRQGTPGRSTEQQHWCRPADEAQPSRRLPRWRVEPSPIRPRTARPHFTPRTRSELHGSAPPSPRSTEDRGAEITLPRLTSRVRIPSLAR
jgi:hypothetical protein